MIAFLFAQYDRHILDPGKQPLFLLLVGFILSFLTIRFSVRMIRRGVSWWPSNIKAGGLHIHHMVFGIAILIVSGVASFALRGDAPGWRDVWAFFFGTGCGLVLDEFALILHLEDVYWKEQGRKSVDAVIIGILIIAILLLGQFPLGARPPTGGRWALVAVICLDAVLALVALLKGKIWTGLLGIFVPVLGLIGAIRLARPGSPWARWRYTSRPRRMTRAVRRERRVHRRADTARTWLFDRIAGAPERSPMIQKSPMLRDAAGRLAQRVAPPDTGAGAGEPREAEEPWLSRLEHYRDDLREDHEESRRRHELRRAARRRRREAARQRGRNTRPPTIR
ncbi:hypothetical protein BIV57_14105 [Mangrovactinospora gilvigrisea]|uniref:Integral membrane protein n=1 Tax=Mangrovactinospora gilvigrisea TaxID=1428644 RepID=A0A1J7BE53_9ACTN|nr:hypothetical protein [Mangrovactinospora gilvigrisea]OIV36853.1 hypothetical protein BIV57_14105 [Mangrovactinospora gilvigrisea]